MWTRKKNKVIAVGIILEKRLARDASYRYRYKVKVSGVDEPMIMLVGMIIHLSVGVGVKVEYDPKRPKRCKLIWDQ